MRSDRQIVVLVGEMPIEILFKRKDFERYSWRTPLQKVQQR